MKQLKFLLIIISLVSFSNLFSQDLPYPLEPLQYDSNLVKEIIENKFNLECKVTKVDTAINSFILTHERSTCLANPKETFNKSDVKFNFLCNLRLLFYGKSLNNNCSFLVYQEGTMSGIEVNGYLFRIKNDKILGIAKLNLAHNLKKYKNFIKLLKSGQFGYSYRYDNFRRS